GIAAHHLRNEAPGRTSQPTALSHETFLRFVGEGAVFNNRNHFFSAASKAMRRILVEGARKRRAHKRGGNLQRVDFSEADRIGFERPSDLLDFNAALMRLAAA